MLYKYATSDRVDILQNMKVRFTPFDQLNDPFECWFLVEPMPSEKERATEDDYVAEWATVCVWLGNRIGQLGLLCLSRCCDNLLMWSHYASDHRGIVLGFDEYHDFFRQTASYIDPDYRTEEVIKLPGFGTLRDVRYASEVPRIEHGEQVPFHAFFTKGLDWEYEHEVRIFRSLRDAPTITGDRLTRIHLFDIPAEVIRQVILGARASRETEEKVISALAHEDLRHVRLDRARLTRREFGLKFENVDLQN